jgi:hypothetical protein
MNDRFIIKLVDFKNQRIENFDDPKIEQQV